MNQERKETIEPALLPKRKEWIKPELMPLGTSKTIEGIPGCGSDGCGTNNSAS